ncbi:polyamine aminopropyltransferase [bacterium]|nr:polyamine aminopropyltransferase [bacterium]
MSEQNLPTQENAMGLVFTEWFPESTGLSFRIVQTIESAQSPLQMIELYETETHGKLLVMDGCVMLTERDEVAYHEMIVHVPLLSHPNPKRVLVIGGGDGGTLREVVRHPSVELARQVEIDGEVVRICKEHLPKIAAAYDNPKVDLIIGDGIEHVKTAPDGSYDIVLIDSTDPFGPALGLFGEEFYRNVDRILADDGIMVCQAESAWYNMPMLKVIVETLQKIFPVVKTFSSQIPVYPSGTWSFGYASKGIDPVADVDQERAEPIEEGGQYYNRDLHKAAFAQPSFVKRELGL